MNQQIKEKWVAALRSGQYKQGLGKLESNGRYCCLGVLCEISKEETGFGITENRAERVAASETLSKTIVAWSGLPAWYGAMVTIDSVKHALINHNDAGRTFLEIADAIEAQL